jgi:glycosyltransferase involved in cell wall biosynthesis
MRLGVSGGEFDSYYTADMLDSVRRAEAEIIEVVDEVWVCTKRDAQLTAELYSNGGNRSVIVPNAVTVPRTLPPNRAVNRLLFMGRLDYQPNVDAALRLVHDIVPYLRVYGVGAEVVIAGAIRCRSCVIWRCPRASRLSLTQLVLTIYLRDPYYAADRRRWKSPEGT